MRGDSFYGQQAAGVQWLHVHPQHLVDEEIMLVLRLADNWRDGRLPEAGGVHDQAALTVASIEIVLATWNRMIAARDRRSREKD